MPPLSSYTGYAIFFSFHLYAELKLLDDDFEEELDFEEEDEDEQDEEEQDEDEQDEDEDNELLELLTSIG